MSSDRAMEVTSLLLREGVLRRDDAEHRAIYEELGKDPILAEAVRERSGAAAAKPTAAERLARVARAAASESDAVDAVRKALEELLT